MGIYANALLSAMEASTDPAHSPTQFWSAPHTFNNMIDTLHAVLECPPSAATQAQLPLHEAADGRAPVSASGPSRP